MKLCELTMFMRWEDWAAWSLYFVLGTWKLIELMNTLGKKVSAWLMR